MNFRKTNFWVRKIISDKDRHYKMIRDQFSKKTQYSLMYIHLKTGHENQWDKTNRIVRRNRSIHYNRKLQLPSLRIGQIQQRETNEETVAHLWKYLTIIRGYIIQQLKICILFSLTQSIHWDRPHSRP